VTYSLSQFLYSSESKTRLFVIAKYVELRGLYNSVYLIALTLDDYSYSQAEGLLARGLRLKLRH
jgi:hypothetical protein